MNGWGEVEPDWRITASGRQYCAQQPVDEPAQQCQRETAWQWPGVSGSLALERQAPVSLSNTSSIGG